MMRLPILTLALMLGALSPAAAARPPAGPTDEQLTEQILALNDLTTNAAMNAKLKSISKDAATAKRMVALAAKMQAVPGKPPLKFNAALVLANAARIQRDFASGEMLYGWCLDQAFKTKSIERLVLTYPTYYAILNLRKKYATVEEVSQKILDVGMLNASNEKDEKEVSLLRNLALEQLILSKSKQGEFNAALDRVEQLITQDKDGPSIGLLSLKATVLRDAGRYDEVVSTYEELLKTLKKLPEGEQKEILDRNFRYFMTAALIDANKVDKCIAVLRELVKEEPENPTYANDLGFILADNGKELEYAEKLIRKAVELDEEQRTHPKPSGGDEDKVGDDESAKGPNASYLDSLGWVLYKRGKYAEALKYLRQAAKDPGDGGHLEIWDHVADTQLALGETAAAIDTWEQSLKFDDLTARDKLRRKEIQGKLKKAKANPPVAKDADKAGK